jgi:hypothetical protein
VRRTFFRRESRPVRFASLHFPSRSLAQGFASRRDRYAMPGAARARAVFRRWNSPKKSLRRSNLQSLDARGFSFLTTVWHKRCTR